jgi:hypothetical protein
VKHLALRARSVNGPHAYTTPGLGDRIHSAILGWVYGQCTGEPVTLHLTADKITGGRFGNKMDSWKEIISLFPTGSIRLRCHEVIPRTESEWLKYLQQKYDVEPYSYRDYPGKLDATPGFDISQYLKRIPPLSAAGSDVELPERFVTLQWDAGSQSRCLPHDRRTHVMKGYPAAVVVGGESKDERLRWSLKDIAYAMSKAELHVGVDSAFFHLAQLYMPWERIHLYGMPGGFKSHHVLRARDNGAPINLHL